MGIKLIGKLPNWVSAKDIVLEMLRRYNWRTRLYIRILWSRFKTLSAWDRHVIANMGTELGATTVFPSDDTTREFLKQEEREDQWVQLEADEGATYDKEIEIDLATIAFNCTSRKPGDVVTVREVSGLAVNQVVLGSSATRIT
jgi:aconitate hydratase